MTKSKIVIIAIKDKLAHNPSMPSIKLNELVKPITQKTVNTTDKIPISMLGKYM